jgi:hypothetical protein
MTAYRDDVEALAARHAALEGEVAAKLRELDAAARVLAEAKAKARLPVLDDLRVAAPCPADWATMSGDERVRHCGQCNKQVFNLSAMTRDEAEALIVDKAGSLCVRYFQRQDGTILLADCTIGVQRRRRRMLVAAGAAALLAGAGGIAAAMSHDEPTGEARWSPEGMRMGAVPVRHVVHDESIAGMLEVAAPSIEDSSVTGAVAVDPRTSDAAPAPRAAPSPPSHREPTARARRH